MGYASISKVLLPRTVGYGIRTAPGVTRVAEVNVQGELHLRLAHRGRHGYSKSGVLVFLSDGGRLDLFSGEGNAIVNIDGRDLLDAADNGCFVVVHRGEEITVPGGAASVEGGEEEASFKDEFVTVGRYRRAVEPALQDVHDQEFVGASALPSRCLAQIVEDAASGGGTRRVRHQLNTTWMVLASALASPSCRATAIRSPALLGCLER